MTLTDLPLRLFRALPAATRERLKATFGMLGHGPSAADGLRARMLAGDTKRVDRSARKTAALLTSHGFAGLAGKDVLEYGVGFLLSDVIAYHLAGARRVVALDYYPILDLAQSRRALGSADHGAIVEALAPHAPADAVRARIDALLALDPFDATGLATLGIDYRAPCDVTRRRLEPGSFDFIHSVSTFEHVPAAIVPDALAALAEGLRPGAVMAHSIHLADHRDIAGAPFAFLAEGDDWSPEQSDARGNRLLAPDWERIARAIPGVEVVRLKATRNDAAALPAILAPSFRALPNDVLRVEWMRLVLRKTS
jgi:hypothetical protein